MADAAVLFKNITIVSLYLPPNEDFLTQSHGALVSCTKLRGDGLCVIDISSIQSIMAMIPYSHPGVFLDQYFLVEKTGMQLAHFGFENDDDDNVL